MRLKVQKDRMLIIPENEQDEAYIENTLRLKKEGDSIPLTRVAPIGLSLSIAYLEMKPNPTGIKIKEDGVSGYLDFKIFTDEKLEYGKDYSYESIAKEMLKIKGVGSVQDYQDKPITEKDWNDSCSGLGTKII